MGKFSPPSAASVATAQTNSNRDTAITQAQLNATDQITPWGNLTYSQAKWPDGTPKITATTSLSPQQKAIFDTGQETAGNLANVARDASGRIGGLIAQPLDFGAQKDYLEGLTSGALDKSWGQDEATLRTALANKGLREGSDAFTRALSDFRGDKTAGYNAANVSNYNTALQSQLALRQAPINEILALAGQSGVQSPAFTATPQTGVAGTDVAGITNNAYNQNQAMGGGILGGIGNIGSAAISAGGIGGLLTGIFSDERLKSDIEDTGERTPDGIPIKTYRYSWEPEGTQREGVIAQDVEKKRPDAIKRIGGIMTVDPLRIPEAA